MNASETRVPSLKNETFELVEDGADHPLGVSALVSRLNGSSSGSDAGSQGSPEAEGCGPEEQRGAEKNFPWLVTFSKHCRAAIGSKSMKQLDDLLTIYLEHVTPHYRDCHKLPNKAAKLKRNINDTMIFFHMLYTDIREPLESSFYYDKMTELMAMYLDLEITASRRGKDTEKTVTNKLSTSLYTFLDHSEDHILDALLKTKLINKHSKKVCVPLLRKILSELVVQRPLGELTYVRFLLSFKLWKNVVADVEERRAINKLAAQRLHPAPDYFLDHEVTKSNAEVLPRIPKSKKNCTIYFMAAKFNVKDSCRAFFRYCKDTSRSNNNLYRRNMSSSEEIEKPYLLTTRSPVDKSNDGDENGSCSLINDIWSTISNGDSSSNLLGESDMFGDIHVEEKTLTPNCLKKEKPQPDSPDSRIESPDKIRRKDPRKKKENTVPVTKYVMLKTEGVVDPVSVPSPAKGVQDCCLGSVFMMEQVNKVGGGQGHVKADPCETELPTSSRQHSVLESLVYAQPGSDNEADASSSVSPEAGSVPTLRLDTNECDSSVEILQSQQVPSDVSLPLELKPALNMEEELRSGKVAKEDLLLFSESDPVADGGGGVFESAFSDFNMFRDDLFNCRSFGDQSSIIYRRSDVAGSLPFQGSPLLEEDEEDFRGFRWSGVTDYASIQSTIINQSGTGPAPDLSPCYTAVDLKNLPEDTEEPKLGQDVKPGKGATPGMLWQTIVYGGKVMRIRSDVLARYRAAYSSYIRTQSVSQPVPQSSPNSVPSLVPSSHASGNSVMLEGSDNLKILAEEAVRVREASVAEAKCKSDLAANLNLPLKKRKSLAPVTNLAGSDSTVVNGEPSYPSAPMLSIAQVQGMNKSVIVMNSQYSWPSAQSPAATTTSATQVKDSGFTTVMGNEDANDLNKPIDMSSAKKAVYTQSVQAVAKDTSGSYKLHCKFCKRTGCQCSLEDTNKIDTQVKTAIICCEAENCAGVCRSLKQPMPQYSSAINTVECASCRSTTCSGKCSVHQGNPGLTDSRNKAKISDAANPKVTNGILKTTPVIYACPQCNDAKCDGRCRLKVSANEGTKIQRVTFQVLSTKAVLKCFQCKSAACNGKCMTSHSRCTTASSSSRKSTRCILCKIPSCNGSCKIAVLKCNHCFSENCEGTCYLTGRSTNNSLSTVNDFSVLNTFAFTDKQTKCTACSKLCCGKCKTATGFKYCPYCNADVYSSNSISHSVKSILGTSTKSKGDVAVSTQKRAKASTAGRRTRSSSTLSKQFSSAVVNDAQSFSVDDVKRRKKSLPKPVAR